VASCRSVYTTWRACAASKVCSHKWKGSVESCMTREGAPQPAAGAAIGPQALRGTCSLQSWMMGVGTSATCRQLHAVVCRSVGVVRGPLSTPDALSMEG